MPARMLVIDDDPASLDLASYLLRAFGYEVHTASDGAAGLALGRSVRPDLVVCDIRMEGVDGFGFLERAMVDPQLREAAFVAITARERDQIMRAGFDCVIEKPLDPAGFVRAVEAFLPASLRSERKVGRARPEARPEVLPDGPARATLLVVDDTPSNLELKRCCLEPHGYAVLTAGHASRALLRARRHHPDLILSDVHMAEGSGFAFLRAVKADPELAHVPFVLISSTHWEDAVQRHGLALGASRYVLRPIHPRALVALVEECLAESRAARAARAREPER